MFRFSKRIWVWLKRFRYRKGYGVHSPFAFDLITQVVYEKYPYYRFADFREIRRQVESQLKSSYLNPLKTDELLFRLVNRMQPDFVVEVGTSSGLTTLYLSQVKADLICHTFDKTANCDRLVEKLLSGSANVRFHHGEMLSELRKTLAEIPSVDFLYLNDQDCARSAYEICIGKTSARSLFVIKGIHGSDLQRKWWKSVIKDNRTGITFDLYDIGLVFFDKQKIKQHYIVNF